MCLTQHLVKDVRYNCKIIRCLFSSNVLIFLNKFNSIFYGNGSNELWCFRKNYTEIASQVLGMLF